MDGPIRRVGFDQFDVAVANFEIKKITDRLVKVYDGDDFNGRRVSFGLGKYGTLEMDTAGMQDKINSIEIPVGLEVTLWNDEFNGLSQTYKGP